MNTVSLLDQDLGAIDVSSPLIRHNDIVNFVIKEAVYKPTQKGGGMISLQLATTEPTISQEGETLPAGKVVFDNVNCKPAPGAKPAAQEMCAKNTASIVQATKFAGCKQYGTTAAQQLAAAEQWASQLTGLPVRAKVIIEPAGVSPSGKAFKAKNAIGLYVIPKS